MKSFKYEMHTHTCDISKCASISAEALVQFYKDQGYSGICVTNHFIGGNTTIPKDLSWEEQINCYCSAYERALSYGQKIGISVFFGFEYSYRGTDFLVYGLEKDWLIRHPDFVNLKLKDLLAFLRAEDGFVIQAHPYRESSYIDMIRLLPRNVDGVEAINSSRPDFENDRAKEYAENYDLLQIGGSDNHNGYQKRLSGIQSTRELTNIKDIINAIKNKKVEIFVDYL
ncbi:MAG: histidinol phosphatase [Clostridiales bacterium]|nr:histidinol phosphatase [Clostridiales bacterium]